MAYNRNFNNNNNSRYNGNGGYRNNNYDRYDNGFRPQNRPANNIVFDGTKYKKPDIEIKDMNGKSYIISGNFPDMFSIEMYRDIDTIKQFTNEDEKLRNDLSPSELVELFGLLKKWVVNFLNLNTSGTVYTMEEVMPGFNDVYCLADLFKKIVGILNMSAAEAKSKAQMINRPVTENENENNG